jgi:hypothetical protein
VESALINKIYGIIKVFKIKNIIHITLLTRIKILAADKKLCLLSCLLKKAVGHRDKNTGILQWLLPTTVL